jgi:PGF-CTERM protein
MYHRTVYKISLIAALVTLIVVASGTAAAQTVDNVEVSLSDTDGDGLDDSLSVDVQVTDDGAATAITVDGPIGSLEIPSDDDGSQAPVTNVSGSTATFGSTGYTGTYTVEGSLSGQTEGDTVAVAAWVGNVQRSDADDIAEVSATVSGTTETTDDSTEDDEIDEAPNVGNGTSNETVESDEDETVGEESETEAEENSTDTQSEGLPGFTALVALLAILTATTVVLRNK